MRKIVHPFITIILLISCATFSFAAESQKLTIVYTGDTTSQIEPVRF